MNMTVHIYVRHMLVHIHRFMGEKEKILIHQRIFTDLIKTRLQPPAPAPPAVMITENQYLIAVQTADNVPGCLKT
ncbi:hypothetical protein D3C80_1928490 [compost metagenome]